MRDRPTAQNAKYDYRPGKNEFVRPTAMITIARAQTSDRRYRQLPTSKTPTAPATPVFSNEENNAKRRENSPQHTRQDAARRRHEHQHQ
jgi:hypothetical protein